MSIENSEITTIMKLRLLFHQYYSENPQSIDIPERIHTREFAIQWWENNWRCRKHTKLDDVGNKIQVGCGQSGKSFKPITKCPNCGSKDISITKWTRHGGYKSKEDLLRNLSTIAPHSIYHSAAFYGFPTAISMNEKEWLGAELVFDIDADHLELKCANDHDTWKCKNPDCNETGTGKAPEICPKCGDNWYCINPNCDVQQIISTDEPPKNCPKCESKPSRKLFGFHTRKWICKECLNTARRHTIKLYDEFLTNDLGFDPDNIQINYSGHRGYHIRVHDPKVYKLDSNARMEIVQYVMGSGFRGSKVIVSQAGSNIIPARDIPGWSGKLADAMIEFIQNLSSYTGREKWVNILRDKKNPTRLTVKGEAAVKMFERHRPILSAKVKGISLNSWQEIAERAVELYGSEIDKPVTHDIHRVIRLIGSLNGKTGFVVSELTRDGLDSFKPFSDAVVFHEGTLKVRFHKGPIPEFIIDDEKYGPYKGGSVELPMAAAVFVLGKEVALLE